MARRAIALTQPWMTTRDRDLVLRVLRLQARAGVLRVLEWGSGGSTIWFPRQLTDVALSWLTVEHDAVFAEGLRVPPTVTQVVVPVGQCGPQRLQRHPALRRAFERYIATGTGPFDVVLVDGRMRRLCLLRAATLIPAGVVLLHDAQRPRYRCARSAYTHGTELGDALWMGAQSDEVWAHVAADLCAESSQSVAGQGG